MKRIRVAGYKWAKSIFGKVIRFKQKRINKLPKRYCVYSHIELDFWEESFSSSEMDGWVRFKQIERKSANWDFIDIYISKKQYNKLYKFAQKQAGNSYWRWGIFFAQALNINLKWENTYFCSEIVTILLQLAHISDRICFKSALFVTPWQLMYLLEGGKHIITND